MVKKSVLGPPINTYYSGLVVFTFFRKGCTAITDKKSVLNAFNCSSESSKVLWIENGIFDTSIFDFPY